MHTFVLVLFHIKTNDIIGENHFSEILEIDILAKIWKPIYFCQDNITICFLLLLKREKVKINNVGVATLNDLEVLASQTSK